MRRYEAFLDEEIAGVRAMDAGQGAERGKVRLVLLLAGAVLLLLAANVYAVAEIRSDSPESRAPETRSPPPAAPAEPTTTQEARKQRARPKRQARREAPAQPPVRLVVAAVGGDSWVEAHSESPTGPLLHQGTLSDGEAIRLDGRQLWLRLGAATRLTFSLNGRPVDAGLHGTVDVLVTPQGIQPATG